MICYKNKADRYYRRFPKKPDDVIIINSYVIIIIKLKIIII